MLDLEKTQSGFRVWGVVPDESTKLALLGELAGFGSVKIDVVSEIESQRSDQPVAVPWQGFQGDAPPLAQEQLGKFFANDP